MGTSVLLWLEASIIYHLSAIEMYHLFVILWARRAQCAATDLIHSVERRRQLLFENSKVQWARSGH